MILALATCNLVLILLFIFLQIIRVCRYHLITNRSGSLLFFWKPSIDYAHVTSAWTKKFGFTPTQKSFFSSLLGTEKIHPDDKYDLYSMLMAIKKGATYGESTIRILIGNNEYLWSRICMARMRFGDVSGIIIDVDQERREIEMMQALAERDSLTELYNKGTAEQMISDYLNSEGKDGIHALLIIDIDDFKLVNDQLGHLFGDAVLSDVARRVSLPFRDSDIVGRIGGDEFIVLMKNVSSSSAIRNRADEICKAFQENFLTSKKDYTISASIGISQYPNDGQSYQTLFHHADSALYAAKRKGKNQFYFYTPALNEILFSSPKQFIRKKTHSFSITEHLIKDISSYSLLIKDNFSMFNEIIPSILSILGKRYQLDRVIVYESDLSINCAKKKYEWFNNGTSPAVEQINYEDYSDYIHCYDSNGIFYCQNTENLTTNLREFYQKQGVQSVLCLAIAMNEHFLGCITFSDCHNTRKWIKSEIDALILISKILSVLLNGDELLSTPFIN